MPFVGKPLSLSRARAQNYLNAFVCLQCLIAQPMLGHTANMRMNEPCLDCSAERDTPGSVAIIVYTLHITRLRFPALPKHYMYTASSADQPLMVSKMSEDWSLVQAEVAEGFYPVRCAMVRVMFDHLAFGGFASFVVVGVIHTIFWRHFVHGEKKKTSLSNMCSFDWQPSPVYHACARP